MLEDGGLGIEILNGFLIGNPLLSVPLREELRMEDDGLCSIGTDRDDRDGYSDFPFDKGDVVL